MQNLEQVPARFEIWNYDGFSNRSRSPKRKDRHRRALMNEMKSNQSPDVFSRKWLLIVILCMVPLFFLFALSGDPGRGREAAISGGLIAMAIKARWDLRKYAWFWAIAAVLIALHMFLVFRVPWTDKSYPAYTLLPFGMLDYGIMYGTFKLAEVMMKPSDGAIS